MIRPDTVQTVLAADARIETVDLGVEVDTAEAAADAEALIVGVEDEVPSTVFEECDQLQILARAGVGVENIDVAAAADHGVTVTNVPDYCNEEVSSHAVALLLAGVRRLGVYDGAVDRGQWNWQDGQPIHRLSTKTVGFHSFGTLAKRTAEKLSALGCDLVAADPFVEADEMADCGVEKVSPDDLFTRADHISIYAPLTDLNEQLGRDIGAVFDGDQPEGAVDPEN